MLAAFKGYKSCYNAENIYIIYMWCIYKLLEGLYLLVLEAAHV